MRLKDITEKDLSEKKVFVYVKENSDQIVSKKYDQILENTGYYLIPGEAKLANGKILPALFGISSDDGGEMFEFYLLMNSRLVSNGEISEIPDSNKKDIFPLSYRLNVSVNGDLHLDNQY